MWNPTISRFLQVWFVFSGNGSQWPKMGATLLEGSPTFRASVRACAAVVRPLGIDLEGEFRAEAGWESPLMASLGLIAVQIGLVDVLREQYGIRPAGMLGHSAGETSLLARIAGDKKGGDGHGAGTLCRGSELGVGRSWGIYGCA